MKRMPGLALAACLVLLVTTIALRAYVGPYGFGVFLRHGGTYWFTVGTKSPQLSPAMRLALTDAPAAAAGAFEWRTIGEGFDVGDLAVLVDGAAVDHIMLARIDPARFRFSVRNAPAGDKDLDQWRTQLGAALVVNGSYYSREARPDTPVVSEGALLGPKDYDAKAGAFVASSSFVGIRDLAELDWHAAFQGVDNAMVSFPLLLANGTNRVRHVSQWLANRSFVGQDSAGRIIIGTTTDAFFSLDRLARFLIAAPLDLTLALNLDGGPVACQGIALNGYARKTYGRWEARVEGDRVQLLTWPYGTVDMPLVLAVFPK
jgi:hypothetical protein